MLRRAHAHHRDLLARTTAQTPPDAAAAKDQDRHLMIPTPRSGTQSYARCCCWSAANTAGACLASPLVRATTAKVTTIGQRKIPISRSSLHSQATRAAKILVS